MGRAGRWAEVLDFLVKSFEYIQLRAGGRGRHEVGVDGNILSVRPHSHNTSPDTQNASPDIQNQVQISKILIQTLKIQVQPPPTHASPQDDIG